MLDQMFAFAGAFFNVVLRVLMFLRLLLLIGVLGLALFGVVYYFGPFATEVEFCMRCRLNKFYNEQIDIIVEIFFYLITFKFEILCISVVLYHYPLF